MALTYSKFEKFTCNLVRSIIKIGFAGMHQLKESLVVMKLLWRLRLKLVLRCKTTASKIFLSLRMTIKDFKPRLKICINYKIVLPSQFIFETTVSPPQLISVRGQTSWKQRR